jgi:hypothetical protein
LLHDTSSHDVPAQGVAASALITLHISTNASAASAPPTATTHWAFPDIIGARPLLTLELLKPVLILAEPSVEVAVACWMSKPALSQQRLKAIILLELAAAAPVVIVTTCAPRSVPPFEKEVVSMVDVLMGPHRLFTVLLHVPESEVIIHPTSANPVA